MGPEEEDGTAANAAATRALVNQSIMRSPRHGHSFARQMVQVIPGRRSCAACGKRVWKNGCYCLLCGEVIHRGCHMHSGLARCRAESMVYVSEEPGASWDTIVAAKASSAASRYLSMQRLASTSAGRFALRGVLPENIWNVADSSGLSSLDEDGEAMAEESAKLKSKKPKGRIASLSALYEVATAAKHNLALLDNAQENDGTRSTDGRVKSRGVRLGLWAGAAVSGTVAGAAVGSAMAGPAGALLGAKLAQAAVASGATASNVGALVGGAAVSYRQRYLLRNFSADDGGAAAAAARAACWERRDEAERLVLKALRVKGVDPLEPFAAAAAAATAKFAARRAAKKLPLLLEFDPDGQHRDLGSKLSMIDDLDAQVALFAQAILKKSEEEEEETAPASVHAELGRVFGEGSSSSGKGDAASRALKWIRCVSIAVVQYHSGLATNSDALEATFNEVDRVVLASCYDQVLAALDEPSKDQKLLLACDDIQPLAPKPHRIHFSRAVAALKSMQNQRAPNDKLKCVVVAIESVARTSEVPDDETPADLLLPLAVDMVRAARLDHAHAHLNLIERLGRDDGLGVQGYALTTLYCAIAVLTRHLDHHEHARQQRGEKHKGGAPITTLSSAAAPETTTRLKSASVPSGNSPLEDKILSDEPPLLLLE